MNTTTAPLSRPTQRRGDERRLRLLAALHELLKERGIPDVTFVAVCARAGIPHGSARHFYPDLDAALRGLLAQYGAMHDEQLARPLRGKATLEWRALVHCLIDRSARFHQQNPVFAMLVLSGQTPAELKRLDRDADADRARFLLERLDRYFVVPPHADNERVAFYATEVVDTAFMLSMREYGSVRPWWIRQARQATVDVLERHFGELQRRRRP